MIGAPLGFTMASSVPGLCILQASHTARLNPNPPDHVEPPRTLIPQICVLGIRRSCYALRTDVDVAAATTMGGESHLGNKDRMP